jgi:pimeloyl-ACP methyl ester carboxylesterase
MPVPESLQAYQRQIQLPELSLHAYVAGSGAPIVLLHGLGDEADTWQYVLPLLAESHTVIAFDLPGFGRSDKPRRPYSLGFYAQTLGELLKALQIERATLVGHSLGAAIAQRFALAHPEMVERLVLVGGSLPIEQHGPASSSWLFLTPGLGELIYTSLRRSQAGAYETLRPYYFDLDALPQELRDFLNERVWARVWSSGQRRGFLSTFRWLHIDGYLRAKQFRMRLAELDLPVHLIWGEADKVRPAASAEAMAALLPNARLDLIANAGHNLQQEQPAELVRLIEGE